MHKSLSHALALALAASHAAAQPTKTPVATAFPLPASPPPPPPPAHPPRQMFDVFSPSGRVLDMDPPSFLGLRTSSGTHSGSEWFASLLSSINITTFFQYAGQCGNGTATEVTLQSLLDGGCKCHVSGYGAELTAHRKWCEDRCITNRCSRPVVVVPPSGGQWKLAVGMAREKHVPVITWERENSVKHAVSQLKAKCKTGSLANHAKSSRVNSTPGRLLLEPRALVQLAVRNQQARAQLRSLPLNVSFAAAYEAFQADARAELARLALATGIGSVDMATSSGSNLVKVVGESLSELVLHFDLVNATFARWPCLHRQLVSKTVERFPAACTAAEMPSSDEVARIPSLAESGALDAAALRAPPWHVGAHHPSPGEKFILPCGAANVTNCPASWGLRGRFDVCVVPR